MFKLAPHYEYMIHTLSSAGAATAYKRDGALVYVSLRLTQRTARVCYREIAMILSARYTSPIKPRPSCRFQKERESYLLHQREVKLSEGLVSPCPRLKGFQHKCSALRQGENPFNMSSTKDHTHHLTG